MSLALLGLLDDRLGAGRDPEPDDDAAGGADRRADATALPAGSASASGAFVVTGLQQTASVAAMFVFAILYFGVITDAGVLDPIVGRRSARRRPQPDAHRRRIGAARAARAPRWVRRGDVSRDHSGRASALRSLGMDRRVLACVVSLAAGVNILPWTRADAACRRRRCTFRRASCSAPLVPVQCGRAGASCSRSRMARPARRPGVGRRGVDRGRGQSPSRARAHRGRSDASAARTASGSTSH